MHGKPAIQGQAIRYGRGRDMIWHRRRCGTLWKRHHSRGNGGGGGRAIEGQEWNCEQWKDSGNQEISRWKYDPTWGRGEGGNHGAGICSSKNPGTRRRKRMGKTLICNMIRFTLVSSARNKGRGSMDTYLETLSDKVSWNWEKIF